MKRALVVLAAVLVAAPAPAAAKEITSAKVCGADGCNEVKDKKQLALLAEGGDPTDPPRHASGWYTVTLRIDAGEEHGHWSIAVVPRARMIRTYDEEAGAYRWMPISLRAAQTYARAAEGLEPFPAAKLRGLHPKPPAVRVVETVLPPADAADDGGFPYWMVAVVVAAALAALSVRRLSSAGSRRGTRGARPWRALPRRGSGAPPPAGPLDADPGSPSR